MWYLSRTPHSNPNDSVDSIFSVSDTQLFQEICIVKVLRLPPSSQTSQSRDDPDKDPNPCPRGPWESFAFLPNGSVTELRGVVVPRSPSTMTQLIEIRLEARFLCAKLAVFYTYKFQDSSWHDIPKMTCEHRNPFAAACALLDGWLYLAGGYEGTPTLAEPSTYLNSAERLDLSTWEWEALPSMQKARAFATGIGHKSKFYVFGGAAPNNSAEIFDPLSNTWESVDTCVPMGAEGYAVTSVSEKLIILTWSNYRGVKLWRLDKEEEIVNGNFTGHWKFKCFFPDNLVELPRLKHHGAKLVQVGKEVFVLTGEFSDICDWRVHGQEGLPIFPAQLYRPGDGHEVVPMRHIHAFSIQVDDSIDWRQIPVYVIKR